MGWWKRPGVFEMEWENYSFFFRVGHQKMQALEEPDIIEEVERFTMAELTQAV